MDPRAVEATTFGSATLKRTLFQMDPRAVEALGVSPVLLAASRFQMDPRAVEAASLGRSSSSLSKVSDGPSCG